MKILITAPHSLCNTKTTVRSCDLVANSVSDKLSFEFTKNKIDNIVLKSDILREKLDLNREVSSNSVFHINLSKIIKDNKIKMCLDIHSFPNLDPLNKQKDIYLLVHEKTDLVKNFINYLQSNLNVSIFWGKSKYSKNYEVEGTNFILDRMHENNIPAILIEFYELIDIKKLDEIINLLVMFF